MSSSSTKPRQKLIDAAFELFVSQGIAHTATRQIANLASVNEATLFRNFGNKYGLLQAVIEEADLFAALGTQIKSHLQGEDHVPRSLKEYAHAFLQAVDEQQALLCSLIGEAENYSDDFKATLTQALAESNGRLTTLTQECLPEVRLEDEMFLALFHGLLLGYTILKLAGQIPDPWSTPDNYVDAVLRLLEPDQTQDVVVPASDRHGVQDLPREVVHGVLQQAKKQGARAYAIAYLLFGAGVTPAEICALKQGDRLADAQQQILTIRRGDRARQVPINQWIQGKRYGSYTSNPLSKYLKSRKDTGEYLLVTDIGLAMTSVDIEQVWEQICAGLNATYFLWQSAQTWRVEMLTRGITLENLSILTGDDIEKLEPFAQRAREKIALEQALELDKKN